MSLCQAGECTRPAAKDRLCWGHYKRRQRGQRLGALRAGQGYPLEPKDPHTRLKDAALELYNAEGDDDFERAWANLLDAADWAALGVPKISRLQKLGYRLLSELRGKMRAAYRGESAPRPP